MISKRSPKNFRSKLFLVAICGFLSIGVRAADSDQPVYVSELPNLNDYSLFANGGWDGNWYVGFNNGWVKKLPKIPARKYSRAFIGAKLGRAKTLPPVGRPPEFRPVPGEIWAAISSTPSWSGKSHVKLASTEDIPLEPSAEYALDNTGEAQWYWAEISTSAVNLTGENFLVVWSPTKELTSVSSSPVLAAGWGGKELNTWLAKDLKGKPPQDSVKALATGLSYFQPALVLKLIPEGSTRTLRVTVASWQNGTPERPRPVVTASVEGKSIQRVWLERNEPVRRGDVIRGNWVRLGRSLWKEPYIFSIDQRNLPDGRHLLRVSAENIWEEQASSPPFEIDVSVKNKTK